MRQKYETMTEREEVTVRLGAREREKSVGRSLSQGWLARSTQQRAFSRANVTVCSITANLCLHRKAERKPKQGQTALRAKAIK